MDEVELATGLIFLLWFGGKCQEFMPFESESPFYFLKGNNQKQD